LGRTAAPIIGGAILALTNNGFQSLYLAVGIAGITAFVLAFLLLSEKKKSQTENVNRKKVTGTIFQGWRQVIQNRGVLVVSFVQAIQYYVFGTVEFFIVGYMINVAKLDALYSGAFLSLEVATLIVARPILGRLSDKKGRRLPIILGSLISCLLIGAIPFTTAFPVLLLLAVCYGLGFAMVISSTSPLTSELAPQGLIGSSMGFLCTMMDTGQTIGPIISGIVLGSTLQYPWMFASLSLLLFAAALIFFFSKTAKTRQPTKT
jgi:DHA1 family multidrug resistance protein-like MFS transporter